MTDEEREEIVGRVVGILTMFEVGAAEPEKVAAALRKVADELDPDE